MLHRTRYSSHYEWSEHPAGPKLGAFDLRSDGHITSFRIMDYLDRDHKYGSRMMSELIEEAQVLGLKELTLDVLGDNVPAIRLYAGAGFRCVSPPDREWVSHNNRWFKAHSASSACEFARRGYDFKLGAAGMKKTL